MTAELQLLTDELKAIRDHVNSLDLEVRQLRQELRRERGPVEVAPDVPMSRPRTPVQEPAVGAEADIAPVRRVRTFLTSGNTVVRVGIIILFFGIAFSLRYMAEHTHLPIEWRLAGILAGGVTLLVVGWRLRITRAAFALPLQGGGLGILYLAVFAALRLYALVPATIAFPILGSVAVLSALLAVLQNSLSLMLLGAVGGFLAPVLASTGTGSHVVLFGYYALLNVGILAMAWFKAWRPLNLVGFVFTFGIGTAWGVLRYQSELFTSIEPFLALFFLLYLAIAILFTWRQPVQLTGSVDSILVFGTPLVVFALQSTLLRERHMPLACSAAAMSAVYLALAWLVHRPLHRPRESQALLMQAFLVIGVGLMTVAIPLAFNARWTAAAWSLESTALIWVGCRQHHRAPARLAGALLSLVCGLIAAGEFDWSSGRAVLPIADYPGVILLSASSLIAACVLHQHRRHLTPFEKPLSTALFWWGIGWWLTCGLCSWAAKLQIGRLFAGSDVWSAVAWVLPPMLFLWQLPRLMAGEAWPFAKTRRAYLFTMGMGLSVFLYGWSLAANLSSPGDFAPLPYCPLLNPLDATQACVLLILWRWWPMLKTVESSGLPRIDAKVQVAALTALAFLWLNAILLRTLHQWFAVAYRWDALMESTLVQTSLSIFWTLLAFLIMLLAARRHRRMIWLVGAALLGVVIAKLFLVDLSRVGSIERIVSFVGVGLLMLAIGYISPLPPTEIGED